MARPKKVGLEYFPFDVDFFHDIKIRKLIKFQGGKAISVYALLLCIIYKQGYYMRWDKELPFIVSELTGFEEVYIQEVIKNCLSLGLFDLRMFENHKVLTSKGIQERYIEICQRVKRKVVIDEFTCVSSEETPVYSEETPVYSEETPVYSEETPVYSAKSTQRKEKESKYISSSLRSEDKSETEISDVGPPREAKSILEYFNQRMESKTIPCVVKLGGRRKDFLLARLKEYGSDNVRKAIDNAAESMFLNGGNSRGFIASFEWIFRPNNFPKVLEGNYANTKTSSSYANSGDSQAKAERLAEYSRLVDRLHAEADARRGE